MKFPADFSELKQFSDFVGMIIRAIFCVAAFLYLLFMGGFRWIINSSDGIGVGAVTSFIGFMTAAVFFLWCGLALMNGIRVVLVSNLRSHNRLSNAMLAVFSLLVFYGIFGGIVSLAFGSLPSANFRRLSAPNSEPTRSSNGSLVPTTIRAALRLHRNPSLHR